MAWNQPGGNGGKDPWGGRGGQQGPPDLDEVLKKLQARLHRLFGSGKTSGTGAGGGGGISLPGGSGKGILLLVIVALVGWVIAGIYIVDPPEQGVVLRFGKYVRTTDPGPHWVPYFIESVEKVNVDIVREEEIGFRRTGTSVTSVPRESLMLTEDENIIDIMFAVQYRVKDAAAYLFNVRDPDLVLRVATESAVREIVGRNSMDFVITEGRDVVAGEAEVLIQEILDRYGTGLHVSSVNMQNAQPPTEVQAAFADAVKAREDEQRFINQARAYAADILPKARGDASAIRERSMAYQARVIAAAEGETSRFLQVLAEYDKAPEITRERLYIEAVESVLANSSKVLMDVKGGNSLMYLPIDKLLSSQGSSTSAQSTGRGADDMIGQRQGGLDESLQRRSELRDRTR